MRATLLAGMAQRSHMMGCDWQSSWRCGGGAVSHADGWLESDLIGSFHSVLLQNPPEFFEVDVNNIYNIINLRQHVNILICDKSWFIAPIA